MIVRQSRRSFVDRVDFVTSFGHGRGPGDRERLGLCGAGPTLVITDLGVFRPDPASRELELTAVHPGVTVEHVRDATGWHLQVAGELNETPAPSHDELTALRALRKAA